MSRFHTKEILSTKRLYPLRYHPIQSALWSSPHRFNVVPSGRRCLEGGTLVCTPSGPIEIQKLKVGDEVIGFENDKASITKVTETHYNGVQQVVDLMNRTTTYLAGTKNHKLWTCNEKSEGSQYYERKTIGEIDKWRRVKKQYVLKLIQGGYKFVNFTYALGALLGDGCSRDSKGDKGGKANNQKNLYISSPNSLIPEHIARTLGCTCRKVCDNNYNYALKYGRGVVDVIPFYREWCHCRYSYEKKAVWEEVDTWNKQSALSFLAGVLDTDGSIYKKGKSGTQLVISIGMQAKSIIDVCSNIIFKYFQEKPSRYIDKNLKYKNGDIYYLRVEVGVVVQRILKVLNKYLVLRKDKDTSSLVCNIRRDRIGLKKGKKRRVKTYDITVGNSTNLYILHHGGIVTSNSGKTEICGKRKIILKALQGTKYEHSRFGVGAPTRDQAKRIYWEDLKSMIAPTFIREKSETDLSITLITGTSIHVVGLDKPERIEGVPWDGFVLDEYGNMKSQTWPEHIRPALADRNGWCDFIGVPEGRNHYYKLHKRALSIKAKRWGSYHWVSADILSPEEILSAKEDLDERTFKQEFEGSFLNFAGMVYYPFSEGLHYAKLTYNPESPLIFCFDFNVSPGVAVVVQEEIIGGGVTVSNIIGEVYIPDDSNTILVCKKLKHDWKKHKGKVYCYGDKTGGARGTAKVLGSDWDLIRSSLSQQWSRISYDLPKRNPREKDRVNSVNTKLLNANGVVKTKIDPSKAPHVVDDFEGTLLDKSGTGEIDKKSDPTLTHYTDAWGYYVHKVFPVYKDEYRKRSSAQYWK